VAGVAHGAVAANPNAFNRALQMPDGDQAKRSRHHTGFLEPDAADLLLAENAKQLRERLAAAGVPAVAVEEHLGVLGNREAMEAALIWYRARGAIRTPLGPIRVPTLNIWGDADDTVGRAAAEGTRDFVAAPYRFENPARRRPFRRRPGTRSRQRAVVSTRRERSRLTDRAHRGRGTSLPRKCCTAANGARRHGERKSEGRARGIRARTT
jgi:hypothetical protein